MRECFFGSHSVPATRENIPGVLSLIIYSLLAVISVKYFALVMRADNQGEGGILVLLGVFGASLLYGDGMNTPAIGLRVRPRSKRTGQSVRSRSKVGKKAERHFRFVFWSSRVQNSARRVARCSAPDAFLLFRPLFSSSWPRFRHTPRA